MQLSSQYSATTQIVRVDVPRIDAAVAIQFKDTIRGAVSPGVDRIILDLTEVEFIDSSGLGAVVAVMKENAGRAKLDLAGLQPGVDKVFRLTRMDTIFDIFDATEDALAHAPE